MKQPVKQKRKFGFKLVKKKSTTLKQLAVDPKTNKAKFTQDLIDTVIKKAAVERQQMLVAECKVRLENMGFEFENDTALVKFFKERLKIAKLNDMNYLYLDFVSPTDPGTLIICYNENMEKAETPLKVA